MIEDNKDSAGSTYITCDQDIYVDWGHVGRFIHWYGKNGWVSLVDDACCACIVIFGNDRLMHPRWRRWLQIVSPRRLTTTPPTRWRRGRLRRREIRPRRLPYPTWISAWNKRNGPHRRLRWAYTTWHSRYAFFVFFHFCLFNVKQREICANQRRDETMFFSWMRLPLPNWRRISKSWRSIARRWRTSDRPCFRRSTFYARDASAWRRDSKWRGRIIVKLWTSFAMSISLT